MPNSQEEALTSAAYGRLTVWYRVPRVSDGRGKWQADESTICGVPPSRPLRGAVFHNVGTTAATAERLFGSQHCDRGHPRGTRRGETP